MLTVSKEINDTTLTLHICGVLDYSTIETFNENIVEFIRIPNIVLDFSKMEFTDSTGISAILELIYKAHEHNINVQFTGLKDEAKDIFETLGVFRILEALRKEG